MPLIDLKTDLKSLKYGKDRPGGGDSGQPYQKVDINTVDSGFNRFRMTNFDDGLVRGGVVGAANASVVDTLRIGKFLKDLPKGPLFILKQVGLQLSNPIIEHKTDFPTNRLTRGQGLFRNIGNIVSNVANKILNAVGPTRIYNLGINTLAQVPVNAFGQHITRHGFTPRRNDDNLYFKVAQHNNNEGNNRLTQLRSILGNTRNINTYIGGPSSIYGIGSTTIQRRGKFIDIIRDTTASVWATSKTVNDSSYVQSSAKNLISTSNLKIGADLGLSRKRFSKLVGNLNIPIDPSGSAAYDRIALKSDPKNITYNAVGQEASASAKMRTPNEFVGASKFAFSSLSSTTFSGLTSTDNKPQTLNAKIYSEYVLNSVSASHTVTASNDLGLSSEYFSTPDLPKPDKATYSGIIRQDIPLQVNGDKIISTTEVVVKNTTTTKNASYDAYKNIIDSKKLRERTYTVDGNQVNAFGIYSSNNDVVGEAVYNGISPSSTKYPVYSNGEKIIKLNIPWNKIDRAERVGSGRQDSLNLTPIFTESAGTIGDVVNISGLEKNIKDLVKFRIQALNGDNPALADYMIFRAYITQYSDNTDATWNPVKYAGRGEDFYIYGGFSRKIQIGFKVAALSAEEMKPMYQKLNYLMGNLMPDYNNNLMRGPLVKMTVGNWIDGQDGILNNVSYTIPQDSPWEISLGDQQLILPHVVEVSLGFTPIGSQTKGVNLLPSKSQVISHIAQNANADVNYIGG